MAGTLHWGDWITLGQTNQSMWKTHAPIRTQPCIWTQWIRLNIFETHQVCSVQCVNPMLWSPSPNGSKWSLFMALGFSYYSLFLTISHQVTQATDSQEPKERLSWGRIRCSAHRFVRVFFICGEIGAKRSNIKKHEVLIPSGKQTVRYWKWPSRNSGFTLL